MLDISYSDEPISPDFDAEYDKLVNDLAKKFYQLLVKNILTNKFGFHNAPSTIVRKGGRSTPMVDTMEYVNAIEVSGNRVYIREGVHSSGISYTVLSDLLEYGRRDKGFEGFPVWRKTREEFDQFMIPAVEAFIQQQMRLM